jgi:hypothetical protein
MEEITMEGKNPREGCAALVLRYYLQHRAGVARIRQTWLPTGRIRHPDAASQTSVLSVRYAMLRVVSD